MIALNQTQFAYLIKNIPLAKYIIMIYNNDNIILKILKPYKL